MVKIREAIVVAGRYDKNTFSQIVDAPIFQTNGFGLRNDKELMHLLRRVAKERGLIILTDSDSGGFMIRNFLKGAIEAEYLKHAYIPDIYGKERRKSAPGKEGKLGVEGMKKDVILQALHRAGATVLGEESTRTSGNITKQDLMALGLSGGQDSSQRRKLLLKELDLPEHMSSNAMLQALNLLYTLSELEGILCKLGFGENHD